MNNRTRLSRVDSAKFVLAWNVGQVLIQTFLETIKGTKISNVNLCFILSSEQQMKSAV